MKAITSTRKAYVFVISAALLLYVVQANAAKDIQIKENWIREAPPNAEMLAAYFTITNTGKSDKTLVSLHSDAFKKVEMHKTVKKGNLSSMVEQKKLRIAAGKSVKFSAGGYHLMLMHPKSAIKAKQTHNITFKFDDNSEITQPFPVIKRKSSDGHEHSHRHGDDSRNMPEMNHDMSSDAQHQHQHDM